MIFDKTKKKIKLNTRNLNLNCFTTILESLMARNMITTDTVLHWP